MEKLKKKEKEEKGVILTMSLSLDKARGPLPGVIFFFFFLIRSEVGKRWVLSEPCSFSLSLVNVFIGTSVKTLFFFFCWWAGLSRENFRFWCFFIDRRIQVSFNNEIFRILS